MTSSLSLYIHVPFCVKKCHYCDFYSVKYHEELADNFVSALIAEWQIVQKEYDFYDTQIATIFFGGGTPSLLSTRQWERINVELIQTLLLCRNLEWTIECNPDSFTQEHAELWLSLGVTRLTFGIQSLDDRELKFLGRPHSSLQAVTVLQSPILSEFNSIGADLMYGLPGQTIRSWNNSLNKVLSLPVIKHLSAYELTLAHNTGFGRHASILPLPSEDDVCEMSALLHDRCKLGGFERYEISNFAKQGFTCKHNAAYWNHSSYIGLGPGAHSYIALHRFSSTKNVNTYIQALANKTRPVDFIEKIDNIKLADEIIFLRLRTTDGLDEIDFLNRTNHHFYDGARIVVLDEFLKQDLMAHENGRWRITEKGYLLTDAIVKKLI